MLSPGAGSVIFNGEHQKSQKVKTCGKSSSSDVRPVGSKCLMNLVVPIKSCSFSAVTRVPSAWTHNIHGTLYGAAFCECKCLAAQF